MQATTKQKWLKILATHHKAQADIVPDDWVGAPELKSALKITGKRLTDWVRDGTIERKRFRVARGEKVLSLFYYRPKK